MRPTPRSTRLLLSLPLWGAFQCPDGLKLGGSSLRPRRALVPLGLLLAGASTLAHGGLAVSEDDFLSDMPVVLSVSRLPQPLDETPGAVSILDRDTIRRSGARDVADLLRLVPGFRISNSFESVAPQVSYHGIFGRYSNRIEVLVDGRSVYSPYFIGSIGAGLQTVALEDIERIEVLRGSNSAAYGARAFLGVINIVTRHSADTLGAQGALSVGENSIRDAQARLGLGSEQGTFRLSADRRSDDGLSGANSRNAVERVNLRADLNPAPGHELQLRLGALDIAANRGLPTNPGDPYRPFGFSTAYAQADYRLSLSGSADLALKLSHNREHYDDTFAYSLLPLGIDDVYWASASGRARSDAVSAQITQRHSATLRTVWGAEYRTERVVSAPLYFTDAPFDTDFFRLFGNVEWRLAPDWLLNAGALAEKNSVTGNTVSPRVMLNWHVAPGHTLRAGVSRAFRPPSTYEKFADVRFVYQGYTFGTNAQASGRVQDETISAREIGYLGELASLGLALDVRLFDEKFDNLISFDNEGRRDYVNERAFNLRGLEYQARWQPWPGGQISLNQTYIHNNRPGAPDDVLVTAAPKVASSLVVMQQLPQQVDLTLTYVDDRPAGLVADSAYAVKRTDLRLSKTWRSGTRRTELAFTVHNLGQAYPDYKGQYLFERQAFVTLRIED